MSACKSCGKSIVWAETPNGKAGPFEVDPDGEWAISEDMKARHVGKSPVQGELGKPPPQRYTSHFATCPDRDAWRKK